MSDSNQTTHTSEKEFRRVMWNLSYVVWNDDYSLTFLHNVELVWFISANERKMQKGAPAIPAYCRWIALFESTRTEDDIPSDVGHRPPLRSTSSLF